MKLLRFTLLAVILTLAVNFNTKADDLNTKKMELITKEMLDLMVKGDNAGEKLRKYISDEWLERKKINLKKYLINNYSPETFEIVYSGGDVCIATIGGASWQHLLVFKFTEEYGLYKIIPRGISEASSDYIDPWNYVKDYICQSKDLDEHVPPEQK